MKSIKFIIVIFIFTSLVFSCKKEGRLDHTDPNAPAPKQVYDIKVENTAGGAVVTYKIPIDPNFAYVKAVYEIRPGVYREAKASLYTDTLALVGYGDTQDHKVELYSIGKNEKASDPILIDIKPLIPPVQSTFETIELQETFGGVQLSFQNETKANLAIELLVEDGQDWSIVNTFYTGAPEGVFSARGFDEKEKKFAISIRDRWNNKSDTLIRVLTPIFEEEIPKDWAAVHLPTDSWQTAASGYSLAYLWDGRIGAFTGIFAGANSSVLPNWFTIDLKRKVVISRIRMHHQENQHLYQGSAVKAFELWGSNSPVSDGSWESWDYLGTFNSFKPSGAAMGTNMPEDKEYGWFLGEEFGFDELIPAYRFIRWKTLETYGSAGQVVIAEIDVFGQIKN